MRQLFHQLVRPMATTETVGALINGLRVVAIDGTYASHANQKKMI